MDTKRGTPGIHMFGIDLDGEVVFEIYAWPDENAEALMVELRRDPDVKLPNVVEVVQGVGRSLYRLANNPSTLEILQGPDLEVRIDGESPF